MITCFGWEWDYIANNIDIPRLKAITEYQATTPPLHQLVGEYFGFGNSKSNNKQIANNKENIEEDLLSFFEKNDIKEAPYNGPRMM